MLREPAKVVESDNLNRDLDIINKLINLTEQFVIQWELVTSNANYRHYQVEHSNYVFVLKYQKRTDLTYMPVTVEVNIYGTGSDPIYDIPTLTANFRLFNAIRFQDADVVEFRKKFLDN